ncbi:MAG: threonylcarbamoyl-AMP synthase [Candidatus Aenigmarchaeota archaeon]|nr:threonylcarbamoyl-AMP synthase [Candidatus Aenigmarchaeota archaeon]
MRILKINPHKPEKELIKLASDVLKNDGIVVYPTDTLYGIAANALSRRAILEVYKVKGRDYRKPLSVAFHSLLQVKKYVEFNSIALRLAKKFLPGPLTIILPMKHMFPKELTFGSEKVGVRIPDNKISLKLIKECGFPITATSANISGNNDPITAEDAISQIGSKVDMILDGGKCKYSKPSTVVEILDKIKILREGVINGGSIYKFVKV